MNGRRGPDSESTGSELPAPYESPWISLGRDLRAVGASLGLRLRELWRRQWQGDLPVPRGWPRRLTRLFWPLLLGLLVALLSLPMVVAQWRAAGPVGPEAGAPSAPEAAAPSGPEASSHPPDGLKPEGQEGNTRVPPVMEPANAREGALDDGQGGDPLRAQLAAGDPLGLIVASRPRPAEALLELEISAGFTALEGQSREKQAELWRQLADSLGYEALVLRDRQGRCLARSALVGSGMILLDRSEAG